MGLFDNLWTSNKYGSLSKSESEQKKDKISVPLLDSVDNSRPSFGIGQSSKSKLIQKNYDIDEKPEFTDEYEVQDNDTLISIAARFWTTPTFIKSLNKLSTQHVFTGQVLLVPKIERKQLSKH